MLQFNEQDGDQRLVISDDLNWKGSLVSQTFQFPGAPMEEE